VKQFFGYIRVSTVKQGQQGVSLQEQRDAISRYASRNGLEIVSWFEEQETAAKRGRPIFNRMLKFLRQGKASGIVLHKIDRGARNLKDWADIGELSDDGIQVHFANESLDLHSRGGRLSADIQAVVAADYIRNLREETLKGFLGRLKQGVYPLPAPLGYVNTGKGKPKEPDPMTAPLVRKAFELYATGRYSFDTLAPELYRLGLRNRKGRPVTRNGLTTLLNNRFYIGLMYLKRTGQVFDGRHTPLVSKSLFDRVQLILSGKTNTRVQKHDFLFRRLLRCKQCGYTLIGELQKGHHYYRCHTRRCPVTGIREEVVEQAIEKRLTTLHFNDQELRYFRAKIAELKATWVGREEEMRSAAKLALGQVEDRLNRLTDAFLDGTIEKDVFEHRKTALLMEKKGLEHNLATVSEQNRLFPDRLAEFLELAGSAWLSYRTGIPEEKRDLVKKLTSNREVDGKDVVVDLYSPFKEVANRASVPSGDSEPDIPRTCDKILSMLSALIVPILSISPAEYRIGE
jgi:DNA invertase Pin-like site-specific DNA recombinase